MREALGVLALYFAYLAPVALFVGILYWILWSLA